MHPLAPVQVAHYEVSGGGIRPLTGDPSVEIVPPIEQHRSEYALLVPELFSANFISILSPSGKPVLVDGTDVSLALRPFGSGPYSRTILPAEPGLHRVSCPDRCQVEVTGRGFAVSYLYLGGMDVREIVE